MCNGTTYTVEQGKIWIESERKKGRTEPTKMRYFLSPFNLEF